MKQYKNISEIAKSFGVTKGDFIYLSSDIMALAFITKKNEGIFDANKIIDCFIDEITEEGTLVIPTFSFDFSNIGFYDIKKTKCTTGALGNVALERPDFKRTRNPMHSFAVWGKYQDILCNIKNNNSFGKDSPFAFMYNNNAIQIMLGTDYQRSMTFVHYVEAEAKVPYRFLKEFWGTYVDELGNRRQIRIEYPARYYEYGSVEKFNRIGSILEQNNISDVIYFNDIKSYKVKLNPSYEYIFSDAVNNQCRNLYDFSVDRSLIWK